jgi:NAD(P)-dependent dehydrogenase (short-subunit alcohol dehydrogenase family)
MRLLGKIAIITGAATGLAGEIRGIGGAAAWAFAREGATVYLSDINDEMGERAAAQISEAGGDAHYVHLDVTNEELWREVIGSIVEAEGGLDVLVNNAGIGIPDYDADYSDAEGPQNAEEALKVEFTTVEGLERELRVHARGAMLGMKYAVPQMRKRGGGSIVNVSSIHGIIGVNTITAYSTAKAAIRHMSKTVAIQYANENIRVNSVHPGYTKTPLALPLFTDPELFADRTSQIPLGRFAEPEEIAESILFLASDEASYITGAELVIDGGVIAQ